MRKIELYWQILIAFCLAIVFGILFKNAVPYVSWMGVVFLKGLNMVIIPLIVSSMISGVVNIGDAKNLGRVGLKTMSYFILTSIVALFTGLILVNLIKPGVGAELGLHQNPLELSLTKVTFGDVLLNIVPSNIVKAMVENQILSIIFFSLLFGFFITKTEVKYKSILSEFFNAIFEVMMKLTMFIIKFTPLGIFGIIAKLVAEQENLGALFSRLGLYGLVVILGL